MYMAPTSTMSASVKRKKEKERKQGKGRVLRAQKEGSSGPMRNRRDGGHFNDWDEQREEESGTE